MTAFCFRGVGVAGRRSGCFPRPVADQTQSFGRAPVGPVSGSDGGKRTRLMLSSMVGVGAVRQMSQCSFSG